MRIADQAIDRADICPFFDGPGWRWRRALQLSTRSADAGLDEDVVVRRAFRYLRRNKKRLSQNLDPIDPVDSAIAAVLAIERDFEKVRRLRLKVLAGFSQEDIAAHFGTVAPIVWLWERLFFDVRARRSAWAWIEEFIINPELAEGDSQYAAELQRALVFGRVTIDMMRCIDGHAA